MAMYMLRNSGASYPFSRSHVRELWPMQTQQYPRVRQHYCSTNSHFHDNPLNLEPNKQSTVGKLYENSLYFMEKRLEKSPRKATQTEMDGTLAPTLPAYKTLSIPGSWTGRLPPCYEGNGERPTHIHPCSFTCTMLLASV